MAGDNSTVASTSADSALATNASSVFVQTENAPSNGVQPAPSSDNTLIIAVAAAGGALLLLIAIVVIVVLRRKKKKGGAEAAAAPALAAAPAVVEEFDTSRTLSSRSTKDYVTLSSVGASSQGGDNYNVLPSAPMREMDNLANTSHYKELAAVPVPTYDIVTTAKPPSYNLDEFA